MRKLKAHCQGLSQRIIGVNDFRKFRCYKNKFATKNKASCEPNEMIIKHIDNEMTFQIMWVGNVRKMTVEDEWIKFRLKEVMSDASSKNNIYN